MPSSLFISYSSQDSGVAQKICDFLEAGRILCWMAPRNIPTGADYGSSIIDGINHARLMVLVFSSAANASAHVRGEVERAFSKGIPILPVLVEAVKPTGGMEYFLSSRQWKNAFSGPLDDALRQLRAEVQARLKSDPRLDPPKRLWRRAVNQLGGANVAALLVLAAAGLGLWSVRPRLTPPERWLYAAAIAAGWAGWTIARWAAVGNRRRWVVVSKLAGLVTIAAVWTSAAVSIHRVPGFSHTGVRILVARVSGDGDRQDKIATELRALVSGTQQSARLDVLTLPRRISTRDEAIRVAKQAGAMVVVWGAVTSGRFNARVTTAEGEGIHDADAPIIGDTDLAVEQETFFVEELLVSFLRAYGVYQTGSFDSALEEFTSILDLLKNHDDMRVTRGRITPREATLSNIYFYLGTARYRIYLRDRQPALREAAIKDYRESVRYSLIGATSVFGSPVANLASVLLSAPTPSEINAAADVLRRASCDEPSVETAIPCLYVEYNRGVLANYSDEYEKGRAIFDRLLEARWPALASALTSDSPHRLLIAYAHKNRAYSIVRIADADPAGNRALYDRADTDWRTAAERLATLGAKITPDVFLTRARIDIGLRRPGDAKANLVNARSRGSVDADLHMVEAAAATCEGNADTGAREAGTYAAMLRLSLGSNTAAYQRQKQQAERYWVAVAALCGNPETVRP